MVNFNSIRNPFKPMFIGLNQTGGGMERYRGSFVRDAGCADYLLGPVRG
jgi:hypothetical protein